MISQFGSVADLQKALAETKFFAVAIPYSWTFGGQVKVLPEDPETLIIGQERYAIVHRLDEAKLAIIITTPRPRE